MRNFLRSPLTWMVVAELVVVGALVALAWTAITAASRPALASPAIQQSDSPADTNAVPDEPAVIPGPRGPLPGLNRGLVGAGRVSCPFPPRLEVAFDVARDLEVPLDLQAALQDVARAEADDVGPAVLGRSGSLNCGFFS